MRGVATTWTALPLLLLLLAALSATSQPTDTRAQPRLSSSAALERAAASPPAPTQTRHRCFLGKCTRDINGRMEAAQRTAAAATRALLGERLASAKPGDTVETTCDDFDGTYEAAYWNQKLDHFDDKNDEEWRQHYQIQKRYVYENDTETVFFLNIGGEGAIESKWVCNDDYTYMQTAKRHHAIVIQLEHRFFGPDQSDITNNYRTENLRFLTAEQALEDVRYFITEFSKNYTNPKWLLFGGSYPATLAALSRQQNPDISVGAIASSAPLEPVVDFNKYAAVMEKAFEEYDHKCYQRIKAAFAEMAKSLETDEGRDKLHTAFKFNKPFRSSSSQDASKVVEVTYDNKYTVTTDMFSAFQGQVQYSNDGRDPVNYRKTGDLNVGYTCATMMDDKYKDDLLGALYHVYQVTQDSNNRDNPSADIHVANDFKAANAPYRDTRMTDDDPDGNGPPSNHDALWGRGWAWLSCQQFGWLQTTTGNKLFGPVAPLDYYEHFCNDLFGTSFNRWQFDPTRIDATAAKFGTAATFNATNLYLSNGGYDPWSSLGITDRNNDADHFTSHLTPFAAHCADLYPSYTDEPSGLDKARRILNMQADMFLGREGGFPSPGSNNGPDDGGDNDSSSPAPGNSASSAGAMMALFTAITMFLLSRL